MGNHLSNRNKQDHIKDLVELMREIHHHHESDVAYAKCAAILMDDQIAFQALHTWSNREKDEHERHMK